ncbi:MAG: hypothetical protein OEY01_07935 [Desulfobulbaceae bacterium]|nr:hypothetical protein [Desulfobulbaceae bacterium]HIJ78986.1 hypothetical protein [Deltaproteobacteria bacterium]
MMNYDYDKYRDKRAKVLGVKKRGLGFGALAGLVSMVIVLGLGVAVIPKSIAFFQARHLDDAIYKLQAKTAWPGEVLDDLAGQAGVRSVTAADNGSRIVVTFNRSKTDVHKFSIFFSEHGLQAVLLNKMSHGQRLKMLEKEAHFEAL